MIRYAIGIAVGSVLLAASASAQEVPLNPAQSKITAGAALRVRAEPKAAGKELARLSMGTVVSATARTPEQVEIGGRKDYWYRFTLPDGRSGWSFGGLLVDYNEARRLDIVRGIVSDRMKDLESRMDALMSQEKRDHRPLFGDAVELHRFVAEAAAATTEANAKVELELLALDSFGKALATIPEDGKEKPPFAEWIASHKAVAEHVSFNHHFGGYYLMSGAWWELEKKYRGTPLGEKIAWRATQSPSRAGNDCEGDKVCELEDAQAGAGAYLRAYPNGANAGEALAKLHDAVAALAGPEPAISAEDKAALRSIVVKTGVQKRDEVLKLIDSLTPLKAAK